MAEYADKVMVELKQAMRAKDSERRNAIRLIQAAFKQVAIDEQKDLTTEDELTILEKEAKKRRESIKELTDAGRPEDAEAEQFELDIIMGFLPEQMEEDEIVVLVDEAIAETGASEMRDMGKVMGILVPKTKGRADASLVSKLVRDKLNS